MVEFLNIKMSTSSFIMTVAIIIWAGLSLYWIYYRKSVYESVYNSIPSVFTSLGVLGTFIGIYSGLQDFDVHNISQSIPGLLEGMKTAFLTSILGIIGSIIFGKLSRIQTEKTAKKYPSEVVDEISVLKDILKKLQDAHSYEHAFFSEIKSFNNELLEVSENIASTIHQNQQALDTISQQLSIENQNSAQHNQEIQIVRQTLLHNAAETNQKFEEFSSLLAKNNTEALVEVMKSATEEFNNQMSALVNKLVQENFEELNNSVHKLNSWQQENKQMITLLTDKFLEVSNDLNFSATAIKEINLNTKELTDENSHLSKLIQELQKVMIEDNKFEKITDKLSLTIETLQDNTKSFNETTDKLNNWVKNQMNFTDSVAILLNKLEDVKNVKDINETFWKNFENQLNTSMSVIEKASNKLIEDLESINDEFYDQLNDVLKNFDNAFQRIINNKES